MASRSISIIIPARNEELLIGACIESLENHAPGELLEILVIDNASTDRTAAIARTFPHVRVIEEPRRGSNLARQRGLDEARGELCAFIDADTRITPAWFPIICREFDAHERLVALSGPYYFDDLPRLQRLFIWCFWLGSCMLTQLITGHMLTGGNFVAKKSALLSVGGFNTALLFYGDDVDTGKRLHAIGPMKFRSDFYALSSGRRIAKVGFLKMNWLYGMNYLSQMLRGKPYTSGSDDVR